MKNTKENPEKETEQGRDTKKERDRRRDEADKMAT